MAGWKDIVGLVMALAAKEPPFMQIVLGLGAAFSLLMFFEGLRANFVPRRRARPAPVPAPSSAKPAARAKKEAAVTPVRVVQRAVPPHPLKRRVATAKPHSPPRPKIRRRPLVMAAPPIERTLPRVGSFDE